jgi:hypothetical protein
MKVKHFKIKPMKKLHALAITLLTAATSMAQTTISNMDFNSASAYPVTGTVASGITASLNSSEAFQTYTGAATGTSAFVQNTTAGNAIAMTNSSGTNSRYFILALSGSSLAEYQGLQIYLQSQRSSTGATTINIATSTDGSNYTTQSTNISVPTSFGESIISLTGLNGASTVYIKLEASGASSTGTLRIDNLEVQGTFENAWQSSGSNVYFSGGNVGVGTSSPAYPLDVNGAAHVNGALISGATTVSSLTNSGNLSVTGTSIFTGAIKNSALAGSGSRLVQTDATGNITPLTGGTSSQVLFGNNTWGSLPSQVIQTSGSNAYFTGGNFGIGNTNPTYPLDVTGNARITGVLTAGGISSSSSNLAISTPATFANSVTLSSLANGTGNQRLSINSGGNIVATAGQQWTQGGDAVGTTIQYLGTIDGNDLPFVAGGAIAPNNAAIERMRLTSNGRLGIGTQTPNALLHVNTQNTGTLPGLIVDNANPTEAPPEFIVNSDGSLVINDNLPTNGDILNINTQAAPAQSGASNTIYNHFRITGSGFVGIGNKLTNYDNEPPQNNVSAYKMLTVNGDASFANYNTSGSGNSTDGFSGLEILGTGNGTTSGAVKTPTRRGITTDFDPDGDFNFYVNSNQASSEFNFVNGANGAITSTNPALVTIASNGDVTIPSLKAGTNLATGNYHTLLIDNATGKLVSSANAVTGTSSAGWNLGGNTGTGNQNIIGTTDADFIFITGTAGTGIERMRITNTGNIAVANNNQILLSGTDSNHGLGAFTTDNTATQFASTNINGPVLYGYAGGALGSNQAQQSGLPLQKIALQWDAAGKVYIGGHNQIGSGHTNALLQIYGDVVVGTNSTANIFVTQQNWSDFVFDKNYKLMPLNELESFYQKNHHLPNVPTTKDIQANGNNLGQTDAVLLQKIEENTLYIVELKKQLEAQQKLIEQLAKKLIEKN